MANIQKLTYPYFTDNETRLEANTLNPIIQKINDIIDKVNGGVTPTQTVATPTISISGTTATISCSTSGATIYYTLNGNTPTTSSTQYSSPITLSAACTIKAIAVKSGMNNSSVASQGYTPSAVATPVISISGTSATITCSTSGATIRYTLDGTTPTASSTQYSSPITLSGACTIKAIAVKSGMTNSSVASQSYTPAAQNITFADSTVKSICVTLFDTNNDGEVSTTEAQAEVTIIGTDGFSGTAITSFNELQYFPNVKLSTDAFKDCASLTSVIFPNPLQCLSSAQFKGCSNLVVTSLPNFANNEIPREFFYNCFNGVNITEIPASITSIGSGAFYGCRTMPKVKVLATTPPTLGSKGAFMTQTQASGGIENYYCEVYVPDASVNAYKAASVWSELADHIHPLTDWTD